METNYQLAIKLLNENIDALHKTAELLLEKETINGSEIDKFLNAENTVNNENTTNEAVNTED